MLSAILLGLVQGLSEFLPISSSGHLALGMHLLDWEDPPLVLSLVVHLGTLAAVFAVYGKDLLAAVRGGLALLWALPKGRGKELFAEDESARLAVGIVVATVPTGAVALLLRDVVEVVTGTPAIVGGIMLACGGMLLASRWLRRGEASVTWGRALLIGAFQGLAVLPGLSRSGTTIVAALALGCSREEAARFSFVASVPAIVGASILEIDPEVLAADGSGWAYAAAGLTAAVTGYVALRVLVRLVRRGALWWFSLYMLPLGIVALVSLR